MIKATLQIGALFFLVAMLTPILVRSATFDWDGTPWHQASRAPSGLAPDPQAEQDAVVQVYAARTYGWRGVFAVHSWIAIKDMGASAYRRFDVIGWGGGRKIRLNYAGPDTYWYGNRPEVLLELRGEEAVKLIPRIEAAVESYPWPLRYRSFPGPNSNTFIAHIAREVPELGLDLPPTAIGKDYRDWSNPVGRPPSGIGLQLSFGGLGGLLVSPVEGLEVNLIGLSAGLDMTPPALRLPGWGRLGGKPETQPPQEP